MATKLIMVPEDLYRGLLSTPRSVTDDDHLNLSFIQNKMKSLKKSKNLNSSAKNALYNQELQRFLKFRQQEKDKPVKVEIAAPSALLQGFKTPSQNFVSSNSESVYDNEGLLFSNKLSTTSQQPTPYTNKLFSPNKENITPAVNKRNTRTDEFLPLPPKKHLEKLRLIKDIIMLNPSKYGVTSEGEILNEKGEPIPECNLDESILRTVSHDPKNTYSPPGTGILRRTLNKDHQIKKIIYDTDFIFPRTTKTAGRAGNFTPKRWK